MAFSGLGSAAAAIAQGMLFGNAGENEEDENVDATTEPRSPIQKPPQRQQSALTPLSRQSSTQAPTPRARAAAFAATPLRSSGLLFGSLPLPGDPALSALDYPASHVADKPFQPIRYVTYISEATNASLLFGVNPKKDLILELCASIRQGHDFKGPADDLLGLLPTLFENHVAVILSQKDTAFTRILHVFKNFDTLNRKLSETSDDNCTRVFLSGFASLSFLLDRVLSPNTVELHGHIVCHLIHKDLPLLLWLYLKMWSYARLGPDNCCADTMARLEHLFHTIVTSFIAGGTHGGRIQGDPINALLAACDTASSKLQNSLLEAIDDHAKALHEDFVHCPPNERSERLQLSTLLMLFRMRMSPAGKPRVRILWATFCEYIGVNHVGTGQGGIMSLCCFDRAGWRLGPALQYTGLSWLTWDLLAALVVLDKLLPARDAIALKELLNPGVGFVPEDDRDVLEEMGMRVARLCQDDVGELLGWAEVLCLLRGPPYGDTQSISRYHKACLWPLASALSRCSRSDPLLFAQHVTAHRASARSTVIFSLSILFRLLAERVNVDNIELVFDVPPAFLTLSSLSDIVLKKWLDVAPKKAELFSRFVNNVLLQAAEAQTDTETQIKILLLPAYMWAAFAAQQASRSSFFGNIDTMVHSALTWPLQYPRITARLMSLATVLNSSRAPAGKSNGTVFAGMLRLSVEALTRLSHQNLLNLLRTIASCNMLELEDTFLAEHGHSVPNIYVYTCDLVAAAIVTNTPTRTLQDVLIDTCASLSKDFGFERAYPRRGGYPQLCLYVRTLLVLQQHRETQTVPLPTVVDSTLLSLVPLLSDQVKARYGKALVEYEKNASVLVAPLRQMLQRFKEGGFSATEIILNRVDLDKRIDNAFRLKYIDERPNLEAFIQVHQACRADTNRLINITHLLQSLNFRCPAIPTDLTGSLDQMRALTLTRMREWIAQQRSALQDISDDQIQTVFFFSSRQSKLFSLFFSRALRTNGLADAVEATLRDFAKLRQERLQVDELKRLYKTIRESRVSFASECAILSQFYRNEQAQDPNLMTHFEAAMALLQLVEELDSVPRFLNMFKLFELEAHQVETVAIERRKNTEIVLAEAAQNLELTREKVYGLQPWMAEYLSILSQCKELLDFIAMQVDFRAMLGLVVDNLQGDDASLSLMYQLQNVFDSARPVIDTLRNREAVSFPQFVASMAAMVGGNRTPSAVISNVLLAPDLSGRIAEIRGLFSRTTADSVESLMPLIRGYLDNGQFRSSLARAPAGPGLVFTVESMVQGQLQTTLIKDIVLRDFVHGLSLYETRLAPSDGSEEGGDGGGSALDVFCKLYKVLLDIHKLRIELESAGHPAYVTDIEAELVRKLRFDDALVLELEHERQELCNVDRYWREAVTIAQDAFPRMLFLSPKLLSALLFQLPRKPDPAALLPFVRECFPEYSFSAPTSVSSMHAVTVAMVIEMLQVQTSAEPSPLPDGVVYADMVRSHYAQLAVVGQALRHVEQCLLEQAEPTVKVDPGPPMVVMFPNSTPLDLFLLCSDLCSTEYTPPTVLTLDCALAELSVAHFSAILKRMERFPTIPCVLLHAEQLGHQLRDMLLTWLAESEDKVVAPVKLVFSDKSGADLFVAFNPIQRQPINIQQDTTAVSTLRSGLALLANRQVVKRFSVLCEPSGTGKTYFIVNEMAREASLPEPGLHLRIAINENFAPIHVVRRLRDHAKPYTRLVLHINASAYCNLSQLQLFLVELILFGRVCDHNTGDMFEIPDTVKRQYFLELTPPPAEESAALSCYNNTSLLLRAVPLAFVLGIRENNLARPVAIHNPDQLGRCYLWISRLLSNELIPENIDALLTAEALTCDRIESVRHEFDRNLGRLLNAAPHAPLPATASDWALFERLLSSSVLFMHDYYVGIKRTYGSRGAFIQAQPVCIHPAKLLTRFLYDALALASRPLSARVDDKSIVTLSVRTIHDGGLPQIDLINFTRAPQLTGYSGLAQADQLDYPTACEHMGRVRNVLAPLMGITNTEVVGDLLREVNYVLTPDGLIKNVLLCERRRAGENAVIVGDTGTGKTMMLRLQSLLMNADCHLFPPRLKLIRDFLVDKWLKRQGPDPKVVPPDYITEALMLARAVTPEPALVKEIIASVLLQVAPDSDDVTDPALSRLGGRSRQDSNAALLAKGDGDAVSVDSSADPVYSELYLQLRSELEDFIVRVFEKYPLLNPTHNIEALIRRHHERSRQAASIPVSPTKAPAPTSAKKAKSTTTVSASLPPASAHVAAAALTVIDPVAEALERRGNSPGQLLLLVSDYFAATHTSLFCELMMSPRITHTAFREHVATVVKRAADIKRISAEMKLAAVPTLLSFIDEFNTTNALLGSVKEIFCDGTLDGEVLPPNIFWVAAMNPKRIRSDAAPTATVQLDHTGVKGLQDEFIVRPEPCGMARLQIDFGVLDPEQEERFVLNSVQTNPPTAGHDFLAELVCACQRFVRQANINRVRVSLRDIIRVRKLHDFFASNSPELARRRGLLLLRTSRYVDSFGFDRWMPFIMSLALSYYLRLPKSGENCRGQLAALIDGALRQVPGFPVSLSSVGFETLVYSCFEGLFDVTEVPQGTARTRTIMENIFLVATSVLVPMPLLVVGPAGCSKTLSFTIVEDNMRGQDSKQRPYQLLPLLRSTRYQCSEQSTDAEIKTVYDNAMTGQRRNPQVAYVVFMDERNTRHATMLLVLTVQAGLTPEEEMPLKAIHYELDRSEVASVLLSNKILDAAKTNRTLQLFHDAPSAEDTRLLAVACLFDRKSTLDTTQKKIVDGICQGYRDVVNFTKTAAFEQRDFIFFLRNVRDMLQSSTTEYDCLSLGVCIAKSLQRNFNGASYEMFCECVARPFLTGMSRAYDELASHVGATLTALGDCTVERMRECLLETLGDADPNTSAIRNVMVIDPTPTGSAVELMLQLGLVDPTRVRVMHVASFAADCDDKSRGDVVADVKTAMAKGETVVLINSLSIQSSFYDVFNRHFRTLVRKDENGQDTRVYFANVAIGSLSKSCVVHKDFRVIAVFPEAQMPCIPLPLRSRFAKFRLSCSHLLHHRLQQRMAANHGEDPYPKVLVDDQWISIFGLLKDSVGRMVDELHVKLCSSTLLYGFVPQETLASLFLRVDAVTTNPSNITIPSPIHAQQALDKDEAPSQPDAATPDTGMQSSVVRFTECVRLINFLLLQQARPERLFLCRRLPSAYLREVLLHQEHFSACRFVKALVDALTTRPRPRQEMLARKWVVMSRSCAGFQRLGTSSKLLEHLVGAGMIGATQCLQLGSVPSAVQCGKAIEDFYSDQSKQLLVVVADTTACTAAGIQCARYLVNCAEVRQVVRQGTADAGADGDSFKAVVFLVHFPPEQATVDVVFCNSVFLNNWDFACVDSLGVEVSRVQQDVTQFVEDNDVRTWILAACGDRGVKISLSSLLGAFKQVMDTFFMRHLASFKKLQPMNLKDVTHSKALFTAAPQDRFAALNELLSESGAADRFSRMLLERFVKAWKSSVLAELFRNVCNAIISGLAVGSIEVSIRVHLGHLLEPMVVAFLRKLLRDFAIERIVAELRADQDRARAMAMLVAAAVHGIPLPSVQAVFSEAAPALGSLRLQLNNMPRLPMFMEISEGLAVAANEVMAVRFAGTHRSTPQMVQYMMQFMAARWRALHDQAVLIGREPSLRRAFFADFVTLTCGLQSLPQRWRDMLADSLEAQVTSGVSPLLVAPEPGREAGALYAVVLNRQALAQLFHQFAAMIMPVISAPLRAPDLRKLQVVAGHLLVKPLEALDRMCLRSLVEILWGLTSAHLADADADAFESLVACLRALHNRVGPVHRLIDEESAVVFQYGALCTLLFAVCYLYDNSQQALQHLAHFPLSLLESYQSHVFAVEASVLLMNFCLRSCSADDKLKRGFVSTVLNCLLLGKTLKGIDIMYVETVCRQFGAAVAVASPSLAVLSPNAHAQFLQSLLQTHEDAHMIRLAAVFVSTLPARDAAFTFTPPPVYDPELLISSLAASSRSLLQSLFGARAPQTRCPALDCLYYTIVHSLQSRDLNGVCEFYCSMDKLLRQSTDDQDLDLARGVGRAAAGLVLLKKSAERLCLQPFDERRLEDVIPLSTLNTIISGKTVCNAGAVFLSSFSALDAVQRLLAVPETLHRLGLAPQWHVTAGGKVEPLSHKFQFCLPVSVEGKHWGNHLATVQAMQALYHDCVQLLAGDEATLISRVPDVGGALGLAAVYRFRMCLLLACYHEYFDRNLACPALHGLGDIHGQLAARLHLNAVPEMHAAFCFFTRGPLDVPDSSDSARWLFSRQARQDKAGANLLYAGLMVNCLAVALGSDPLSNHMFCRLFAHAELATSKCPGSDFNHANRDCGFRCEPELTNFSNPPIMGNNTRYRLALNATTWMPMLLSCIIDPTAVDSLLMHVPLMFGYVDDAQRVGTGLAQRSPQELAREFALHRATGFVAMLETLPQSVTDGLDAVQFITESLLRLWLLCDNQGNLAARPSLLCRRVYPEEIDASKYETFLQTLVFDPVSSKIAVLKRTYDQALLRAGERAVVLPALLALREQRLRTRLGDGIVPSVDLLKEHLGHYLQAIGPGPTAGDATVDTGLLPSSVLLQSVWESGAAQVLHVVSRAMHFLLRLENALHLRITREAAQSMTLEEALGRLRTLGDDQVGGESLTTCFEELCGNWELVKRHLQHTDMCPALRAAQQQGQNIAHEIAIMDLDASTLLINVLDDEVEPSAFVRVISSLLQLQGKIVSSVRMCVGARPKTTSEKFLHEDSKLLARASVLTPGSLFASGLLIDGRGVWQHICRCVLATMQMTPIAELAGFDFDCLWDRVVQETVEKGSLRWSRSQFCYSTAQHEGQAPLLRAPSIQPESTTIADALRERCDKLFATSPQFCVDLTPDLTGRITGVLQTSPHNDIITAGSALLDLLHAMLRPDDDDLDCVAACADRSLEETMLEVLHTTALPPLLNKLRRLPLRALGGLCRAMVAASSDSRAGLFRALPVPLQRRMEPPVLQALEQRIAQQPVVAELLPHVTGLLTFLKAPAVANVAMIDPSLPLFPQIKPLLARQHALADLPLEFLQLLLETPTTADGSCGPVLLCGNLVELLQVVYGWQAHLTKPASTPADAAGSTPTEAGQGEYVEYVPPELEAAQRQQSVSAGDNGAEEELMLDLTIDTMATDFSTVQAHAADASNQYDEWDSNFLSAPWQAPTLPPTTTACGHVNALLLFLASTLVAPQRLDIVRAVRTARPSSSQSSSMAQFHFATLLSRACGGQVDDEKFNNAFELLFNTILVRDHPALFARFGQTLDLALLLRLVASFRDISSRVLSAHFDLKRALDVCPCQLPKATHPTTFVSVSVPSTDAAAAAGTCPSTGFADQLATAISAIQSNVGPCACDDATARPGPACLLAVVERFHFQGSELHFSATALPLPLVAPFHVAHLRGWYYAASVIAVINGHYYTFVRDSPASQVWIKYGAEIESADVSECEALHTTAVLVALKALEAPVPGQSDAVLALTVKHNGQTSELKVAISDIASSLDAVRAAITASLGIADISSITFLDPEMPDDVELMLANDNIADALRTPSSALTVNVTGAAVLRATLLADGQRIQLSCPVTSLEALEDRVRSALSFPGPFSLHYDDSEVGEPAAVGALEQLEVQAQHPDGLVLRAQRVVEGSVAVGSQTEAFEFVPDVLWTEDMMARELLTLLSGLAIVQSIPTATLTLMLRPAGRPAVPLTPATAREVFAQLGSVDIVAEVARVSRKLMCVISASKAQGGLKLGAEVDSCAHLCTTVLAHLEGRTPPVRATAEQLQLKHGGASQATALASLSLDDVVALCPQRTKPHDGSEPLPIVHIFVAKL